MHTKIPELDVRHYEFNGVIYLPKITRISGDFNLNDDCYLEGNSIIVEGDLRDKMEGILFNTKVYCFPGAENNPRNIFAFVLFGDYLTNKLFYLSCQGSELDFSGKYSGTANPREISSKGIEPRRFMSGMCCINQYLQNKEFDKVEIEVNLVNKK